MTTAKNKVFIVLYHENCYFLGGIKIWYGGATFLLVTGLPLIPPPIRKTLL